MDSLLTSFALLLRKIDVESSEMRVINSKRTGKSILLSHSHKHLQRAISVESHAPKHRGHFVTVMVMVPLTRREQDVLYRLLAHVHGREDQVHGLSERHDRLDARVSVQPSNVTTCANSKHQQHAPMRSTGLGLHRRSCQIVRQYVSKCDAKRVEYNPISQSCT